MSNELDYKNFISAVHKKFESSIEENDLKELLSLEEDYNKDSPASVGKSLILTEVYFRGIKVNDTDFEYRRPLKSGVNVWIADNGKGKSTLFKVIKYAITGVNSIKKDVRKWIQEIMLEFEISGAKYTIRIDKHERISSGTLYGMSLEEYRNQLENGKIDGTEKNIFHFRGDESLESQMQTFFFNHFSYYTLKYAQKSSKRDDLTLATASLSWSTYFKAVYLESSDHGNLYFSQEKYHDQGKKILGMILGLKLTYPINRLTLLMHRQEEELGKLKIVTANKDRDSGRFKASLEKELAEIETALNQLTDTGNIPATHDLIEERIKINNEIQITYAEQQRLWNIKRDLEQQRQQRQVMTSNFEDDRKVVESEIKQGTKRVHALKVSQDARKFFTNLEIRTCPNCETAVTQEKIAIESQDHNCRLCGTVPQTETINDDTIDSHIQEIETQISEYKNKKTKLDSTVAVENQKLIEIQNRLSSVNNEIIAITNVDNKKNRLLEIEQELGSIEKRSREIQQILQIRDQLMQGKAVATYRLAEINNQPEARPTIEVDTVILKKDIFSYAIEILKHQRQKLNEELLNKLKGLILKEIQAFGLRNISSVDINENFDLLFVQNGEQMQFDDLTESERLRTKIAFYLSLIQLDIEYQLGRHTRFLIIDSPGNEELSRVNLAGLSDIFKEIERRFENQLQIFIGTALREFEDVSLPSKTHLVPAEEALF